jgi:3-oxoacyl-[acyl-carrier-protein] synthase III
MKRVNIDIEEEEKENIKDFLWKEFGREVLKHATRGLPEFYKEYLAKQNFKE